MIGPVKRAALRGLALPPVWSRLHARAAPPGSVTILCYHTLGSVEGWTARETADFRADIAMLRAGHDIVSLDEGLGRLGDPDTPPTAVLTFDDGDRGLADHLLPILEADPVPVTVYVATGQFETGRPFWFDRVVNALQAPAEIDASGLGRWRLGTETGKARWQVVGDVLARLKDHPEDQRDALADAVVAAAGGDAGGPLGPMTRDDLARLARQPGVTIGAHSHGHELLDRIPADAARTSIARSRDLLRDWTGQEVRHFAYPNGNHSAALQGIVADLGFASATILGERAARGTDDRFALPRVSVGRYDDTVRVKLRMAGI